MARLQRIALLGIPQHIIQRGNNRQACFLLGFTGDDLKYHKLLKYLKLHVTY